LLDGGLGGYEVAGNVGYLNLLIQAIAAHARWSEEGERLLNKY
jgi:hypothetical protein